MILAKLLVWISLVFPVLTISHGLGPLTSVVVADSSDVITIQQLACTDSCGEIFLPSYDVATRSLHMSRLVAGCSVDLPYVLHISFHDTDSIIVASPLQRWFNVDTQQWVFSVELKPADRLLCRDGQAVTVSRVQGDTTPQKLFIVALEEPHTFFVTNNAILTHNSFWEGIDISTIIANGQHYLRYVLPGAEYYGGYGLIGAECLTIGTTSISISGFVGGTLVLYFCGTEIINLGRSCYHWYYGTNNQPNIQRQSPEMTIQEICSDYQPYISESKLLFLGQAESTDVSQAMRKQSEETQLVRCGAHDEQSLVKSCFDEETVTDITGMPPTPNPSEEILTEPVVILPEKIFNQENNLREQATIRLCGVGITKPVVIKNPCLVGISTPKIYWSGCLVKLKKSKDFFGLCYLGKKETSAINTTPCCIGKPATQCNWTPCCIGSKNALDKDVSWLFSKSLLLFAVMGKSKNTPVTKE